MAFIFPEYCAESVSCINGQFLETHSIRAVLLDIDNTISLVDDPLPTPEAEHWLRWARGEGYALGVVSNNDPPRVQPFAERLGLDFCAHAQKPDPQGYLALAEQMGVRPAECLMVGDQLFTDILGANRAGMHTLLVKPLNVAMEPRQFRKRRGAENLCLRLFRGYFRRKSLTVGGK